MRIPQNLKVHMIYPSWTMILTIVFNSSSKEAKVKVKVIKKEINQIKSNNSMLLKRLRTPITKETNLFELFMIISISREITKALSVIEGIVQLITTM
jgi:hypothetical protein